MKHCQMSFFIEAPAGVESDIGKRDIRVRHTVGKIEKGVNCLKKTIMLMYSLGPKYKLSASIREKCFY